MPPKPTSTNQFVSFIFYLSWLNKQFFLLCFTLSSRRPLSPPIFLSVLFSFPFCLVFSFLFCLIHCLPPFFFCYNTSLSSFSPSSFCSTFPFHFLLNFLVLFLLIFHLVFMIILSFLILFLLCNSNYVTQHGKIWRPS